MLDKTNFTTRTDLTPEELQALIAVRTGLETGEISAAQFRMRSTRRDDHSCGTIGCIGGWMSIFMEMNERNGRWYVTANSIDTKFSNLFYPVSVVQIRNWNTLTPAEGIKAINNFLMGAKQPWEGVV